MTQLISNVQIKPQTNSDDNTLVATWTFTPPHGYNASTLDSYTTNWYYVDADGVRYEKGASNFSSRDYDTFKLPRTAYYVDFHIIPQSKKVKVKVGNSEQEQWQWTCPTSVTRYFNTSQRPAQLSAPSVTVDQDKLTLTATSDNSSSDSAMTRVEFQFWRGDPAVLWKTVKVTPDDSEVAKTVITVDQGQTYKVRARGINTVLYQNIAGDWSDFTSAVNTRPQNPSGFTAVRAESSTSVYLAWDEVDTATSYTIEYATDKSYFDGSSEVKSVSATKTFYTITGLDTGKTWWFRLSAKSDAGESGFSTPQSALLGTTPDKPTTWSSNSTAIVGEEVYLYWVHNSEDESVCKQSQLELSTDGGESWARQTINNTTQEEGTLSYLLLTSEYAEGVDILWRVRTMGVLNTYGDWSTVRTISVNAQPTVAMLLKDNAGESVLSLTSYPLMVEATTAPSSQSPVSYYLEIQALSAYTVNDQLGEPVNVSVGDIVFSETSAAIVGESFTRTITPADVTLANGQAYSVSLTVAFDTGLVASDTDTFECLFGDASVSLGAAVGVDSESYVAYVTPEIYSDDTDWTLAVYRREYDGSFKLIQGDLSGAETVTVTDPHPALDYARYRITATNNATGAVEYTDLPNVSVGCLWAVIQWDEVWRTFSAAAIDAEAEPAWAGSLLLLKYNPKTSYDSNVKVETVEYAGREYPVAYYGKLKDTSVSWSFDIERSDTETIFQLRRLQVYDGNVYVRDPSGYGSWANISVSFSRDYDSAVIPVSVSITRVDDGGQP